MSTEVCNFSPWHLNILLKCKYKMSLLLNIRILYMHINGIWVTHHLPSCTAKIFAVFLLTSTANTAQPSKLRITRPNGPELSSPVVVGTSQTLSIWCTAVKTDGPVSGLHWRFPNDSRLPDSNMIREQSEYDVGMVVYLQNNTWIGLLRMNRVQLSFAGIYKCVANLSGMANNRSMEIQVSGGCPLNSKTLWDVECYKFAVHILCMLLSNIAPTWQLKFSSS